MICRPAMDDGELEGILNDAARLPASLISIHAAESLVRLKKTDGLLSHFRSQSHPDASAYQVGVWRVLARIEETSPEREAAVQKIRQILLNQNSAFRVHAMESLAKLKSPILPGERETVHSIAQDDTNPGAPFALWRIALQEPDGPSIPHLTTLLLSENETIRFRSAYVLWHLRPLPEATQRILREQVSAGTLSSLSRLLFALAGDDRSTWEPFVRSDAPSERYFVALELVDHRDDLACTLLQQLLADADLDVRAAAAFSLLK